MVAVAAVRRVGKKALCVAAFDDRRIIPIGRQNAVRRLPVGVANHVEQRGILRRAVDDPVGVENLVAAMFRIGLGEHHQFHVGRVALQTTEVVHQIVDFVGRKRQSQRPVGCFQGRPSVAPQVDASQRCRFGLGEQHGGIVGRRQHRFGHAVMQ